MRKILSLVLVVLMLTSITVPTATASTSASGFAPAVFVIPATADLIVDGALVTILGSAVSSENCEMKQSKDGTSS